MASTWNSRRQAAPAAGASGGVLIWRRREVQVLRDEGLVVTVPQRGTYVVERG